MYNVLIVDDETIVRTSLSTIVDWESLGFHLAGDAVNGKSALKILEIEKVDIVLTDIKMPVMDGIELIENINLMENPPAVIVLSAYNDFDVVRQAFKLGAVDYILKSDINEQVVHDCINNIRMRLKTQEGSTADQMQKPQLSMQAKFKEVLFGNREFDNSFFKGAYSIACFEIENFMEVVGRFGDDLTHSLVQPMENFASQIPRVGNRCLITELSPSIYVLLYAENRERAEEIQFLCAQVQKVWKNYMNIVTTCGISAQSDSTAEFSTILQDAMRNLTVKYIFGSAGVYDSNTQVLFDIKQAQKRTERYAELIDYIKQDNHEMLLVKCQNALEFWHILSKRQAQQECLYLIYQLATMLTQCNDNLWSAFSTDVDFYQKVVRLETTRDVEIWSINFIRWVCDYMEKRFENRPADVMEKAKKFIAVNYSDPGLTLKSVAEYLGFNEKYFSTRFNKEIGRTFSQYLTEIRIQVAKKMIETTNMKSYEISEAVGYSNPEHFSRVFKKVTGITPGAYKK